MHKLTFKSGQPPTPNECEHAWEVPQDESEEAGEDGRLHRSLRRRPLEWRHFRLQRQSPRCDLGRNMLMLSAVQRAARLEGRQAGTGC